MIVEIVEFDLPRRVGRDGARDLYRGTADGWVRCADLVEKYYTFDAERDVGGGIYIWRDLAAQKRWHGADYVAMVRERYGSEPRIRVLDAVLYVEPARQAIVEFLTPGPYPTTRDDAEVQAR